MKIAASLLLALLISITLLGQSTLPVPKFETAMVQVSKPGTDPAGLFNAGRIDFKALTMLDLIGAAYGLEPDLIVGGPHWLNTDRFDVSARAPRTTPDDQLQLMLQNLLAERFGLAIHRMDKPAPIFALTLGKGKSKMKESSGTGAGCGPNQPDPTKPGLNTVACQNITMERFANRLRGMANAYLDHPVVDKTGLSAAYDFTITWTSRGLLRKPTDSDYDPATSITIFEAVDQQLGLKLETQQQMASAVVVDRVNQTPTANPTTTASIEAPAAPTEFEVASVKPIQPDVTVQPNARMLPSGQVEIRGLSLKDLITVAYDVQDDQVVSDQKWVTTDRFEVIAKAAGAVPLDALRVMMQNLLTDQFKLKVHNEERSVAVYGLTASSQSHKMKDSSGEERSECKLSVVDGARTLTCKNTTMKQFTEQIRGYAGAYFDHAVVDMSGLKGAYDFALTWAPLGRINANAAAAAAAAGNASTPTGDITVFQAVEKYLGLKLGPQKSPMPVLVIDHVEKLQQ